MCVCVCVCECVCAYLDVEWNPFCEVTLTRGQPLWKGH